jgi:hypothetical protein
MNHALKDPIDQAALLERVSAFAREVVAPGAIVWERERRVGREAIDQAAAFGLCGIESPREHGGLGLPFSAKVQIAERLAADPGSRTYGIPSLKARWYGEVRMAGNIGRNVFWPEPNVDSALVRVDRREQPTCESGREWVFKVIDTAFAQRRKSLRGALAQLAGSPDAAEQALRAAGIDPGRRGEALTLPEFIALADRLYRADAR